MSQTTAQPTAAQPAQSQTLTDGANSDILFLSFIVDGDVYGMRIAAVTEIIGMHTITPLPNVPDHVRGVINLRGKVIPVMDIRTRFGLDGREADNRTCIVVVSHGTAEVGLLVDTVREVLPIQPAQIETVPNRTGSDQGAFIHAIGKTDDKTVILLDIGRLLAT